MNTVERLKSILKERKIAVSKLERECGFANGYISQLRKGSIPDDRLKIIADYLEVSSYYLTTGKEFSSDYTLQLGESDANFLIEYHKLSESNRKQVERMVKYFIEIQKLYKEKDED